MNRLDAIFSDLRRRGGRALMPFLTAGDPNLAATAALLPALEKAGASVCELGFPFSDPVADGPVIQASMAWALDHGVRPGQVLDMVAQVRPQVQMGLVAMVSYSIVQRMGRRDFVRRSVQAGIDGFIFPDLTLEESAPVRAEVQAAGATCSLLIAPTTPLKRAEQIAQACSGFVYVIARAGVTGERKALPADLGPRLQQLRQVTDLPLAVGFGIAGPDQVRQVVSVADAAIVGSAIMQRVAPGRTQPPAELAEHVGAFVTELATGLPAPVA